MKDNDTRKSWIEESENLVELAAPLLNRYDIPK
jgi:hypothetical protein